jgi:hypothetical protein
MCFQQPTRNAHQRPGIHASIVNNNQICLPSIDPSSVASFEVCLGLYATAPIKKSLGGRLPITRQHQSALTLITLRGNPGNASHPLRYTVKKVSDFHVSSLFQARESLAIVTSRLGTGKSLPSFTVQYNGSSHAIQP